MSTRLYRTSSSVGAPPPSGPPLTISTGVRLFPLPSCKQLTRAPRPPSGRDRQRRMAAAAARQGARPGRPRRPPPSARAVRRVPSAAVRPSGRRRPPAVRPSAVGGRRRPSLDLCKIQTICAVAFNFGSAPRTASNRSAPSKTVPHRIELIGTVPPRAAVPYRRPAVRRRVP